MVDCGLFATRAGSSTFLFDFEIELSTLRVVNYDRVCFFFRRFTSGCRSTCTFGAVFGEFVVNFHFIFSWVGLICI